MVQSSERAEPLLGVGSALLGYLLLIVGFMLIGVAAQTANIIWGLWITEALAIALPAFIFLRAAGVQLAPYLGLRMPEKKWFAIAALSAVLNQPVVSLLTWLAQQGLPHDLVRAFELKNEALDGFFGLHPIAMLVAVSLSAPLGEELFFRGFALPASARSMGPRNALWAGVLTAALFSLMHQDPVGALGLFEIGLWLAVLRWGSGSIFPAMLGHALNNAIAGTWFMLGLQSSGKTPPAWAVQLGIDNPDAPPPFWVLVSGALLALVGVWFALRIFARPSPHPAQEVPTGAPQDSLRPGRAWPLWIVWLLAATRGAGDLIHEVALLIHRAR